MAGATRGGRLVRWCRHHPKSTGLGAALVALVVIAGALGNGGNTDREPVAAPSVTASIQPARPSTPSSASPPTGSARLATTVLASLTIKGRAPKTGYSRAQFGAAWTDDNDSPLGHNGCDTRNDVLRRDLTKLVIKPGSSGCVVLTGTLHDPYTGRSIDFVRGPASAAVQIDHVVSLSDAWQTGAQRYDQRTRTELANDPLNLFAVDGPINAAKGDGDAATWLPPNKAYRCAYVARQIAVKVRYRLWMTAAERDAAARVLSACADQQVPVESGLARLSDSPSPTATRPTVATEGPAGVAYANCAAVRAAGAAPLHAGDPGYDRHLDRDGDGIACE